MQAKLELSSPVAPEVLMLPNGVRLEYLQRGPQAGVPIVFLHGVTDSCRSFEAVMLRMPATVRALSLSQRGHGGSDRPESGYTYSDFAGDLKLFLDEMGIPRAVIVGHSMGSMVAQRFMVDHPERVAGLVLIGAFSTLCGDPGIAEFVAASIDSLEDPIPAEFAREWQLSTAARPIEEGFLNMVVEECRKPPARVWRSAFHGFLETADFSRELTAIAVPALVIWGDRDTYATRVHQDALVRAIPGARLSVHEGAGHALHWEDPDGFVSELLAFWGECGEA